MLLLELPDSYAFLAVSLGFGGAVRVDAAFRKVVCATACSDEGGPSVAVQVGEFGQWQASVMHKETRAWGSCEVE